MVWLLLEPFYSTVKFYKVPHNSPDWSADTLSGIISKVGWWFAVRTFLNLTVVSIACAFYFVKNLFFNLYFLFVFTIFNRFVFPFLFFSFINNSFIVLDLNPAQPMFWASTPDWFEGSNSDRAIIPQNQEFVCRCHNVQYTPLAKRPRRTLHDYYSTFLYGRGRHDGDIFK